ncbi:uncharacterized protein N0V89_011604 [Didymosphaeria variabile]|uniref:F-box domain-containing protein n=1 Tax=Didymosphaeria variabile TaxID=1932322 RepID=A0A9W8XAV2_9PLEO|nr:uncharacterized protein N0V89_011604 [Didymosphaeria variabile]KAJ4345473.1 hypothetical protein N0V89_011604 [Didymosphaeria variabile]
MAAAATNNTDHNVTSKSLVDRPLDIVNLILPHCKPSALAALVRTCKTMRNLAIPVLYEHLDLSCRGTLLPGVYAHPSWVKQVREQKSVIQFLLHNRGIAKLVRTFKLTIGVNYNLQSSLDLYLVFELLENVEQLDIEGTLYQGLDPDNRPLWLEGGLNEKIFTRAKTIKFSGMLHSWLVERILLGGDKPQLTNVEVSHLTTGILQIIHGRKFYFENDMQPYFTFMIRLRAKTLKSWVADGKGHPLGPYNEAASNLWGVREMENHFYSPEIQREYRQWALWARAAFHGR